MGFDFKMDGGTCWRCGEEWLHRIGGIWWQSLQLLPTSTASARAYVTFLSPRALFHSFSGEVIIQVPGKHSTLLWVHTEIVLNYKQLIPQKWFIFFLLLFFFNKCCLQQVVHVNSILIKGEESVLHNSYPRFSWESENSPEGLMKRPAKSVASQMGDLILICLRFSQAVWLALGWLRASEVELRQRGCLDFPEALIWGSG